MKKQTAGVWQKAVISGMALAFIGGGIAALSVPWAFVVTGALVWVDLTLASLQARNRA